MSDEVPEPASVESPLSLGDVFQALTPPGTNGAELLAALKASRRPTIPLSERELMAAPMPPAPGRASASFPADPFTPGKEASAALAEFWGDLVESGIPVESADRIIGTMLAEA